MGYSRHGHWLEGTLKPEKKPEYVSETPDCRNYRNCPQCLEDRTAFELAQFSGCYIRVAKKEGRLKDAERYQKEWEEGLKKYQDSVYYKELIIDFEDGIRPD